MLGVGLTNITYHIYYDGPQALWDRDINSGRFTPIYLNVGYKADRVSWQVGLAYGWDRFHESFIFLRAAGEEIAYLNSSSRTHVVAILVTMRFIWLKAIKRLPIYATATLMPAFGTTTGNRTETQGGVIVTSFTGTDAGMDIFATAGFGFNYKIKNRFGGYAEVLLLKTNLTGRNSYHHDWESYASLGRRLYRSLGIGVNYNL